MHSCHAHRSHPAYTAEALYRAFISSTVAVIVSCRAWRYVLSDSLNALIKHRDEAREERGQHFDTAADSSALISLIRSSPPAHLPRTLYTLHAPSRLPAARLPTASTFRPYRAMHYLFLTRRLDVTRPRVRRLTTRHSGTIAVASMPCTTALPSYHPYIWPL